MDSLLSFVAGVLFGMIIWELMWQWLVRLERRLKDESE